MEKKRETKRKKKRNKWFNDKKDIKDVAKEETELKEMDIKH